MTKEILVSDNKVVPTMAFPFLTVPTRDYLVHSLQEAVMKLGGQIEVKLKRKCL